MRAVVLLNGQDAALQPLAGLGRAPARGDPCLPAEEEITDEITEKSVYWIEIMSGVATDAGSQGQPGAVKGRPRPRCRDEIPIFGSPRRHPPGLSQPRATPATPKEEPVTGSTNVPYGPV